MQFPTASATALTCLFTGLLSPALAQDISGANLTLTGKITQNGTSTNYFEGSYSSFNGSMCVGNSCLTTEANGLGNPAIKLKWSEPQIIMDDTSSATFNDRDWRIGPARSGSARVFMIMDEGTDWENSDEVIPFSIVGGAPANSFWLDSQGRLGLGTSIPQNRIHMVAADSPGILFDQVGSNGNQRWTLSGNEEAFYLGNADTLDYPLIVDVAAPDGALLVDGSGNIGAGVSVPLAPLHVSRTNGTARVLVENTAASPAAPREMFKMSNNGGSYFTLALRPRERRGGAVLRQPFQWRAADGAGPGGEHDHRRPALHRRKLLGGL
ncbi:hypothetical protein [Tropicibacter sp. S64]|uniref:hypothetical protein n=1 Tax=Tropicibacter sp. S64 TaxID=3415122 RepID=UPI003C7DB64B